jgi:hypothetical protein
MKNAEVLLHLKDAGLFLRAATQQDHKIILPPLQEKTLIIFDGEFFFFKTSIYKN